MRLQVLLASSLLLPLTLSSFIKAQIDSASSLAANVGSSSGTVLTGKVAAENGSDLDPNTQVILECGNQKRATAAVDSKGNFALPLPVISSDAEPRLTPGVSAGAAAQESWIGCELYAEEAGFKSSIVNLGGRLLDGIVNVGTLTVKGSPQHDGTGDGFTIDAISLAAPDNAKKAFAQGQEQAKKGKWAAACEHFRRAVQLYPRFALAWLELGRAQLRQNNFADAEQSFQEATTRDTKLIPAYIELARVGVEQKQWKAVADATDKIIELAPNSPAAFWFFNSAAKFNLGDVFSAERSVLTGLRVDAGHKVPQLEYLYGVILARQEKYTAALEHIQSYLKLSPQAANLADVHEKLAFIQSKLAPAESAAK